MISRETLGHAGLFAAIGYVAWAVSQPVGQANQFLSIAALLVIVAVVRRSRRSK